jgi:lipopolysaccharide biosynthesis glycosyltransferase
MNTPEVKKGVLYCATDEVYQKRARLSAYSLKHNNPTLSCCLITNTEVKDEIWDHLIISEKSENGFHQYMLDKITALSLSPYEKTLYLDSDTYILDDINELFSLLDRFDIALCHGHDRQKRYLIQTGQIPIKGTLVKAISDAIPYAFAPLQGGLILYRKNETIEKFLKDLADLYISKHFYDDQVSIRELLWKSNINFYILPPEYNFNSIEVLKYWKKHGFRHAKPKIFHYSSNKNINIQDEIRHVLRNRETLYRNEQPFQREIIKTKLKLLARWIGLSK